jgi:two-component system, chemotaxis family, chemotaxis protein CheY
MNSAAKTVLIVDDAATVRLFCRQILEAEGHRVEEAANGLEGLEKALAGTVDLMVVDVNMPRMDGYAMTRSVRRTPDLWGIPVAMMTTESQDIDRDRAFQAGVNHYMTKPLRPETLKAVVRLMTGGRAS